MKKVAIVAVVIGITLIIFLLLGPFYTVQEGEQAVVTRFGRIVTVETEAGLKIKVPFVDTVTKYSKKIISWDGAAQLVPTLEKKFVFVDTTARWRITNLQLFYESVGSLSQAHSRLDDIIDGEVRTIISRNNFAEAVRNTNEILSYVGTAEAITSGEVISTVISDAVSIDAIEKGRKDLSSQMLVNVQAGTPQFGIEVIDIVIRQIKYSDELTVAVHARMIKERNKEAEKYRSEGLGEKDFWLGKMERELALIQSGAYKEAEEIKGTADATAARIYNDAYGQDPGFFEFWKAIESYRKLLPKFRKTLSTDADYFDYLYQQSPR